jgi:hypothetical protein
MTNLYVNIFEIERIAYGGVLRTGRELIDKEVTLKQEKAVMSKNIRITLEQEEAVNCKGGVFGTGRNTT